MRSKEIRSGSWRVAVVAPCTFPSARGSQVLIRELAEALADRGHEVHLLTYPCGEHLVPIRGIHVHRISAVWMRWLAVLPVLLRKACYDLALIGRLTQVVRRHRVDVIHAHNYEGPMIGMVARWLTGIPVVYHAHNSLADELPCYVKRRWTRAVAKLVGRVLDRQVPRRADHTIALDDDVARFLKGQGVAEPNLTVVPPVPPPVSAASPAVAEDTVSARFNVVYVGNLDPYQDLEVLTAAFWELADSVPEARLWLVTHDAEWRRREVPRLADLVSGGRAKVVVASSFRQVRRLLSEADVLVCPRSSWSGYPIKLLSYLAAGRPIVAAQGSAKGLMHEVNAWVVPNRDPRAMSSALLRLRHDRALALQLAEGARRSALKAPGWGSAVSRLEAIYAAVCGAKVRARPRRMEGFSRVQELIGGSRVRISAASNDRVGKPVRRIAERTNVAVALLLLLSLSGCARQATQYASLPPLDAPLPAPPGQAGPYRLQPGDLLRVKFMYHPELDVKVPIRPDGGITLQVGGNIHAAGLTTEELERVVVERTSDRLREPEVSVLVAQTADLKVYVMGEVRLPGIVPFREGITPLQAVADRGGFSDTARIDSVLRLSPSEDEYQGTRLDFSQPLEAGSPEGVQLRAGDVLYVPRTFIGDVNSFVRLYVRGLLPIEPRIGAATQF
jgi:protein involved in polysaccharide export with SLBB domain/glycosyltransferase involved in cell wall biosynthesis